MIGISSNSAGVIFLPKLGTREYTILDVVGGREQNQVEAQYLYSTAQDWEEIEGSNAKALLEIATREYWLERTVSLLRLVIGGLESSLEKRVFEEVEEIIGSRVSSEKVLDRLLIAPLINPHSPLTPAKSALSCGFSAVASILDELADLQPLIHRLTGLWLSLAESAFSKFIESKEMIWLTLVKKFGVKKLLITNSKRDFIDKWNLLAFHFSSPQSRLGVGVLGNELSCLLFPSEKQKEIIYAQPKEAESFSYDEEIYVVSDYKAFTRIEKEINAIALAVSQGHDARAEMFLKQLIQKQTSSLGGESYAVKSLCNIAQRCADMFRMDFEVVCLDRAIELDPQDAWTLIQYGNHLKRIGNYGGAINVFGQAQKLGEIDFAQSGIADVYAQQGDYENAIHIYKSIPNFNDKPVVLTAIADNLRKIGRLEEAKKIYQDFINSAHQGLVGFIDNKARAQIGIAEIAKREGKYEDALRIYTEILRLKDIDDKNRVFYKLGQCNILKAMNRFNQAFVIVDEVIQEYPFAMEARFIRGSILGLMGQEQKGLNDLPESSGSTSWREWLRSYYRGLLLLKLKRYHDAKKNLVEELPNAIASKDEKAILRMAAALCFLSNDELPEADGVLSDVPNLNDYHTQYLSLVLKFHLATQREDLVKMNSLKRQIATINIEDEKLEKAIEAITNRNFSLALAYETDALLKLAA